MSFYNVKTPELLSREGLEYVQEMKINPWEILEIFQSTPPR